MSSSTTNTSTDETPINTSYDLKSEEIIGVDNTENKIESNDADDPTENARCSTSKRKRKVDEVHDIPQNSEKIAEFETDSSPQVDESIKIAEKKEKIVPESESSTTSIAQSSETIQSTSNRKRKIEDSDNGTQIFKPNVEIDTTLSDTPSNLCSKRSNRDLTSSSTKPDDNTTVVAEHYNSIEEKGLTYRSQSRIFYMRNFNNWIKSMFIIEYIRKVRQCLSHGAPIRVLDMCCGKGGDLLKWKRGNISHLICADIADVTMKQCENRYREFVSQSSNDRGFTPIFTAEFITADCTKVRLREKFKDPSLQLDLVSCQFALHYSFESLPQAMCMLQNASETLKPGGYFIASFPDAYDLVNQWRRVDGNKFGNNIHNVEFSCNKDNIPLFGAKYNFHLEGVVDCPEFLVYLPLLKKLALKKGLEFVHFERFDNLYERYQQEGTLLLGKMQALETYPPYHESPLLGQNPQDYQHALQYMQNSTGHRKIGTLSLPEWEAISLYAVAVFKKMKTSWNAEGKPEYSKL